MILHTLQHLNQSDIRKIKFTNIVFHKNYFQKKTTFESQYNCDFFYYWGTNRTINFNPFGPFIIGIHNNKNSIFPLTHSINNYYHLTNQPIVYIKNLSIFKWPSELAQNYIPIKNNLLLKKEFERFCDINVMERSFEVVYYTVYPYYQSKYLKSIIGQIKLSLNEMEGLRYIKEKSLILLVQSLKTKKFSQYTIVDDVFTEGHKLGYLPFNFIYQYQNRIDNLTQFDLDNFIFDNNIKFDIFNKINENSLLAIKEYYNTNNASSIKEILKELDQYLPELIKLKLISIN